MAADPHQPVAGPVRSRGTRVQRSGASAGERRSVSQALSATSVKVCRARPVRAGLRRFAAPGQRRSRCVGPVRGVAATEARGTGARKTSARVCPACRGPTAGCRAPTVPEARVFRATPWPAVEPGRATPAGTAGGRVGGWAAQRPPSGKALRTRTGRRWARRSPKCRRDSTGAAGGPQGLHRERGAGESAPGWREGPVGGRRVASCSVKGLSRKRVRSWAEVAPYVGDAGGGHGWFSAGAVPAALLPRAQFVAGGPRTHPPSPRPPGPLAEGPPPE